jgi:hypothetical protein
MNEPDFPEGFQDAGPVFAAVPLGDPWYNLALTGATTYIPESASARVDAAFLDREQAERVADAATDGELSRYEGLCGWDDRTAARAEAERQALAELEPGHASADEVNLQPGVTPGMHERLAQANADAKHYAAEIDRLSRIPWPPPLSPEQAAAIRAQAFPAEPEAGS